MSRIMILGANGMAGHMARIYLREHGHEVFSIARSPSPEWTRMDVEDTPTLCGYLQDVKPEIVVNVVGVLIQDSEQHPIRAIRLDALLPQLLSELAQNLQFRLIHLSTDCVFSGANGPYDEASSRDAGDVYGMAKALGEVTCGSDLTIRTSIVGPELKYEGRNLFSWFMKQKGPVRGFSRCLWGGVTTLELAKALDHIIHHPISGLLHLTNGSAISKHDMLELFAEFWSKEDVNIINDIAMVSNRSLICSRKDFCYTVPPYREMLKDMRTFMHDHASLYHHYE